MNSENKTSKFWDSGAGIILKIGGFIGAITTIVAFLMQIFGFWESRKDEKYKDILKKYYKLDSLQQCEQMASMFTSEVEDYFGKSGYTRDSIIKSCVNYRSRWVFYRSIPNYETIKVSASDRGTHIISYELIYKTKKKQTDSWKNYNLSMLVEINSENKIQAISEERKK